MDWGRGKGQVRVARSNRDLTYTQVEQDKTDFELNVRKLVKQFNLQSQRVHIAARTDETAQRRADVARRLYILGKSTVLDLNASISEKDAARRNYITALYNYWSLYYTLRSITLYDFEVDAPLTETESYHILFPQGRQMNIGMSGNGTTLTFFVIDKFLTGLQRIFLI